MSLTEQCLAWLSAAVGASINAVAGGGTFLTFPLLTFLGMTALQANIVSTIALWPGTVASAYAYRHQWAELKHTLPTLMAISVVGSAVGASILLNTPEEQFAALVPYLLLAATILLTFGSQLTEKTRRLSRIPPFSLLPADSQFTACFFQFFVAVYGGYFGAGIGILMLAILQFYPLRDIHQMNAVKTVLGTSINAVAFFIFIFSDLVVWEIAVLMLVGGIVGGYAGARLALKIPARLMRGFVMIIAWVMTGYFMLGE